MIVSVNLRHGNARKVEAMTENEFEDFTPKAGYIITGEYEICDCGKTHEFINGVWKCTTCKI